MPKRFLSRSGSVGLPLCITALLTLTACIWTPDQGVPKFLGVQAAVTKTTSLLRPGQTVTGLDGVQVVAPPLWRAGNTAGVQVTLERLDCASLEFPINDCLSLALPIYSVSTSESVLSADRESFRVRLPLHGLDPAYLWPYRLSTALVESDDPSVNPVRTRWHGDLSPTVTADHVEFESSGLAPDDPQQFTALLLNIPRPNASPQAK